VPEGLLVGIAPLTRHAGPPVLVTPTDTGNSIKSKLCRALNSVGFRMMAMVRGTDVPAARRATADVGWTEVEQRPTQLAPPHIRLYMSREQQLIPVESSDALAGIGALAAPCLHFAVLIDEIKPSVRCGFSGSTYPVVYPASATVAMLRERVIRMAHIPTTARDWRDERPPVRL